MMYFFEELDYTVSKKLVARELEQGRKPTAEEALAKARKAGFRVRKHNLESADYTGHHERLCERADDQGLLHACNDTWLEVRTWNNDIRGVMTLFGWVMGGMTLNFLFGQWRNVISLYMTGHRADGSFLTKTTPLTWLVASLVATAMFTAIFWVGHRYVLRYELFTQRWIRLRFNCKTKKVYLLRPKYAGGLMVFDWTLTDPNLGAKLDPAAPLLSWGVMAWMSKVVGERSTMQFVGRRTSFKTQGDWMTFWEYIRRYMEEGPTAVPRPKTVIGYWPSLKESWISVTQWFPALQQKGLAGKFSDAVTVLILPLIALLLIGNFLGQCLTWQARFPKEIEHAGDEA
jgi:hypothetical protein